MVDHPCTCMKHGCEQLCHTTPTLKARATRAHRRGSALITAAANPYGLSLAWLIYR